MSKHVIDDIGTEILYETCFVHNSTQKAILTRETKSTFSIHFLALYLSSLSKQDLMHFSKIDLLGFACTYFFFDVCPQTATKLRSLQCKLFVK